MKDIDRIKKIFTLLEQQRHDPKIELDYVNDFTLLVAVVLSARATDKSVNKATKDLFHIMKTPEEMLEIGIEEFMQFVKTIGLYRAKSENLFRTAQILIDDFNSKVPNDFDSLVSLPGVGRKSANVILSTLFNKTTIAVDTHVYRVSHRLGLSSNKNLVKLEQDLMSTIPQNFLKKAHHWLVLHGRYTCKAIKPECQKCIISTYCNSKKP